VYRNLEPGTFYAATSGCVMCKRTATGDTVWSVSVAASWVVTLLLDVDWLYAAGRGVVVCLEPTTGKVRWSTVIAGLDSPATLALDPRSPGVHLVVSCEGKLFGLDAESGAVLWEDGLRGMGYHPVCVRVPGGIVAEPRTRKVRSGNSTSKQVLENEQG